MLGIFPSQWKTPVVIQQQKKGTNHAPETFWRIEKTLVMPRKFERLVRRRQSEYLLSHKFIYKGQPDFLKMGWHKICQLDLSCLKWSSPWLSNRHQVVSIKAMLSQPSPVTGGVIQGGFLSPLLFPKSINDVFHIIRTNRQAFQCITFHAQG